LERWKYSLALLFFDEEDNVVPVVESLDDVLARAGLDCQLVLVDNGSRDRTGELIEGLVGKFPRCSRVTVPENLGYGWGAIQGLAACAGEWIGYMDGDAQISPEDVVRFLRKVRPGRPLIKVRRRQRRDGLLRASVSEAYIILFSFLFSTRIYDVNAKPVLFRRELLAVLELKSRDWFIDAELTIKASRLGLSFFEVPVIFRRRPAGQSSVRASTAWEFLGNMLRYRIGKELKEWEKRARSRL